MKKSSKNTTSTESLAEKRARRASKSLLGPEAVKRRAHRKELDEIRDENYDHNSKMLSEMYRDGVIKENDDHKSMQALNYIKAEAASLGSQPYNLPLKSHKEIKRRIDVISDLKKQILLLNPVANVDGISVTRARNLLADTKRAHKPKPLTQKQKNAKRGTTGKRAIKDALDWSILKPFKDLTLTNAAAASNLSIQRIRTLKSKFD